MRNGNLQLGGRRLRQAGVLPSWSYVYEMSYTSLLPTLRACANPQKLRPAWMVYAGTLANCCPRGRW
jgi:hypothetical protein